MIAALDTRSLVWGIRSATIVSIEHGSAARSDAAHLLANFNSHTTRLMYIARQKIQGQHLNCFIVEQLPVVPPDRFDSTRFGPKTAGEIVREAVLELTCTAQDMAPFARDMGHVDESGDTKPPYPWDENRRLHLRAKLDAVFFHLYGITDRDDVRYVYSTFPIVEAPGDGYLRPLPIPRPLPCLYERACCGRSPIQKCCRSPRGGMTKPRIARGL